MCVYQKCPTRYRYDGGGGSRMLNHRLILSGTIQIKIFLPFCASIKMSFLLLVRLDKESDFLSGFFRKISRSRHVCPSEMSFLQLVRLKK